ncbi:hypothetical protein JHK85_040596 [Glycine max]|uniref:Putative glutathione S-transferase n=2 Tax=Glycine subgen. Soja TaxID=1462606 RepID=A0A0B2RBI8_GLYSO|nr:hypothetical protein JHK86_040022 [Glycine max]KAG4965621.1 hypothetical protein JHK85_040596 [Glycine max]KHN29248.1 Putative glutathione S-transferase [Glycine soja]RZB68885.1 putative glutathione S-transferase [Glycine soja]
MEEKKDEEDNIFNEGETEVTMAHAKKLVQSGVLPSDIGIITPYAAQILPTIWNACWSDENRREKAVEEALEALKILQEALKDKKFFGGDNIGLVDIAANFIGYWVPILQDIARLELLTIEKFPSYINRVKSLSITL